MKQILLLMILYVGLLSSEIENLLTKFTQETQLHKDTQKESLGHVTLFTREDLSRMQAYTLNDVLKVMEMFSLQAAKDGGTAISFATSKSSKITPIKLFINNHELNNITFGNPLAQYGAMNLFFVDYIEIYQSGNSVSFGNDSGSVVVKLYTKNPEFENASYGEIILDSHSSKQLNILDARVLDEKYSYLLNVDINSRKMDKIKVNNITLSRDYDIGHLFFQFNKKDDYLIEFGATGGKRDVFAAFSLTPKEDEQNGFNAYLHAEKFFNNKIVLKTSLSIERVRMDYQDSVGILLSDTNNTHVKNMKIDAQTISSSITLEKKFHFENNEFLLAAKVKQNRGKLYDLKFDNQAKEMIKGATVYNIFSVYGENLYNFNDNNLLTFGLKYNLFKDNVSSKKDTSFIYRVGYISHYKSFTNKIFIFNRIIQPTMGQKSFSPIQIKPNTDLKALKINIVSFDSLYTLFHNTKINVGIALARIKDPISINPVKKQYVNVDKIIKFKRVYLNLHHNFNLHNKLKLGYYKVYKDQVFSSSNGALLQLFNKIGKVDIYNELVYRSGYINELKKYIDAGYDYSLAITYPLSKRSILKLKGENIFNKASKVYIYDNPSKNGFYTSVQSARVLAAWEYEF